MGAGRGQIRKGPGVTVRSAPWPSNRSSYNAGVGGTAGGPHGTGPEATLEPRPLQARQVQRVLHNFREPNLTEPSVSNRPQRLPPAGPSHEPAFSVTPQNPHLLSRHPETLGGARGGTEAALRAVHAAEVRLGPPPIARR